MMHKCSYREMMKNVEWGVYFKNRVIVGSGKYVRTRVVSVSQYICQHSMMSHGFCYEIVSR